MLQIVLKTAPEGTGIIAGGPARSVLELAGYTQHPYKVPWDPDNKQNVVLATLEGPDSSSRPQRIVARLRGKSVDEVHT